MPVSACPSAADLRRALTGQADRSATDAVAAHVKQCPHCAAAAAQQLGQAANPDPNQTAAESA